MAQNDATQSQEPQPQAEEQPSPPEVAPLLAVLEAQFGEQLGDEGRERARKQLGTMLTSMAAVAAYPLANADEPGFVFNPFPTE